jgi:hypothetical protein
MWFITHLAFGAALGTWIEEPIWLVVVLALLSHILLDAIPHWDYGDLYRIEICAPIDIFCGFLVLLVMMHQNNVPLACFLGGLASAAPDFEGALYYYGYTSRAYFPSHVKPFPHGKTGRFWGILVQALIVLASLYVVRR